MGSVQQVTVGFICLTAAFIFGSYINQHPSLGEPNSLVQKDDSSIDLELAEKGTESMPQLRHRVESKVSLSDLGKPSIKVTIPDSPSLPSPSELDPRLSLRGTTQPQAKPQAMPQAKPQDDANVAGPIDTGPDFSRMAASIEGDSNAPSPSSMPTVSPSISNIKNIADSFRKTTGNDSQTALTAPDFKVPLEKIPTPSFDNRPQVNPISKKDSPFNTVAPSIAKRDEAPISNEPVASSAGSSDALPTIATHEPEGSRDLSGMTSVLNQSISNVADEPTSVSSTTPRLNEELRGNRVVSLEPNPRVVDSTPSFAADREPSPPVERSLQETSLQSIAPIDGQRTKASLPFSLSGDAKIKLVRLRSEAVRKISLETTRFAEHIVLPGETLQSISTRYLNKPDFYLDIYLANRDRLKNPVEIPQGIVLKVPLYD